MKRIDVVCGVVYNSKNQLLITQRGDEKLYGKWEFPGGKVLPDELISDSIKREILEELSIDIIVQEKVFQNEIEIDGTIYKLIFLSCLYDSGKIILKEHLNYQWIEKNQLGDFDFLEGDFEFINYLKSE